MERSVVLITNPIHIATVSFITSDNVSNKVLLKIIERRKTHWQIRREKKTLQITVLTNQQW